MNWSPWKRVERAKPFLMKKRKKRRRKQPKEVPDKKQLEAEQRLEIIKQQLRYEI